jgi:hypothetical protein
VLKGSFNFSKFHRNPTAVVLIKEIRRLRLLRPA